MPYFKLDLTKLKSLVCQDTTLKYFNMKKPVTIQVDIPVKGLIYISALVTEDGPVTFSSKALTHRAALCKQ